MRGRLVLLGLLALEACHAAAPIDSTDPRRVIGACRMEAARAFGAQPEDPGREHAFTFDCMTAHGWEWDQISAACAAQKTDDDGTCWFRLGSVSEEAQNAAVQLEARGYIYQSGNWVKAPTLNIAPVIPPSNAPDWSNETFLPANNAIQ